MEEKRILVLASKSLENDCMVLGKWVEELNKINISKCKNIYISLHTEFDYLSDKKIIEKKMKNAFIVFIIFDKTIEDKKDKFLELYKTFIDKNEPCIIPIFKGKNEEDLSKEVKSFYDYLATSLKDKNGDISIYYNQYYSTSDELQLIFIKQLNYICDDCSFLNVDKRSNMLTFNGVKDFGINIEDVPYLANSKKRKTIQEKYDKCCEELKEIDIDDEEYNEKFNEKIKIENELKEIDKTIFNAELELIKIFNSKNISSKVIKAKELLDNGDVEGTLQLLNIDDIKELVKEAGNIKNVANKTFDNAVSLIKIRIEALKKEQNIDLDEIKITCDELIGIISNNNLYEYSKDIVKCFQYCFENEIKLKNENVIKKMQRYYDNAKEDNGIILTNTDCANLYYVQYLYSDKKDFDLINKSLDLYNKENIDIVSDDDNYNNAKAIVCKLTDDKFYDFYSDDEKEKLLKNLICVIKVLAKNNINYYTNIIAKMIEFFINKNDYKIGRYFVDTMLLYMNNEDIVFADYVEDNTKIIFSYFLKKFGDVKEACQLEQKIDFNEEITVKNLFEKLDKLYFNCKKILDKNKGKENINIKLEKILNILENNLFDEKDLMYAYNRISMIYVNMKEEKKAYEYELKLYEIKKKNNLMDDLTPIYYAIKFNDYDKIIQFKLDDIEMQLNEFIPPIETYLFYEDSIIDEEDDIDSDVEEVSRCYRKMCENYNYIADIYEYKNDVSKKNEALESIKKIINEYNDKLKNLNMKMNKNYTFEYEIKKLFVNKKEENKQLDDPILDNENKNRINNVFIKSVDIKYIHQMIIGKLNQTISKNYDVEFERDMCMLIVKNQSSKNNITVDDLKLNNLFDVNNKIKYANDNGLKEDTEIVIKKIDCEKGIEKGSIFKYLPIQSTNKESEYYKFGILLFENFDKVNENFYKNMESYLYGKAKESAYINKLKMPKKWICVMLSNDINNIDNNKKNAIGEIFSISKAN